MPAVSGDDEFTGTSVLDAAQLTGVDATAFSDGDLAYLTGSKKFYHLDKSSTAIPDGVLVIATKSGVGRWVLGPNGNGGVALTHVIFVDKTGPAVGASGSIDSPYPSISAALATIPTATNAIDSRQVFMLVISPDSYDEDLAIDITGKRIILASWGPWNLGLFATDPDWAPSPPLRNITVTGSGAPIAGIRPGLAIATFENTGERSTTHQSYFQGPRISGQILVQITGLIELDVQAEVFGTTGTSAGTSLDLTFGGGVISQLYLYNGRFRGRLLGSANCNFQHAEKFRFDGLVSVGIYSLIRECRFNAGMTVTGAGNAGLFPEGLITCWFAPGTTFTGPAASLRLDGNTNYWFKTNGCLLAGGATKVIQDDLVP